MKLILTSLLALICHCASAQRKAVFIIVDGIPADVIEKLRPPMLMGIAGKRGYSKSYVGGLKDGYSQSPTISAVGYNHVLTGTWTNKHNVWDNDIKDPNYNYWNMFRILKHERPESKTAIFSTWQDNRTKLVGDKLAKAGNVSIDYAFDGFELDTARFSHNNKRYISDIDALVSAEAAKYIQQNGPDLSWVYLEFTDDMGHAFGDSPQFYDAIKKADEQLGEIWRAVQERQTKFNEDWMIVITTDHGRDAKTGKGHGNQSDRERTTWMVTNATGLNKHFYNGLAAVDIAPSVLRYLNTNIPDGIREEMDGIPFIGKISLDHLHAEKNGNNINLTWNSDSNENATILLSTTNNFKTGEPDTYQTVGTTKLSVKKFTIDASKYPSSFYKIVVKGNDNWSNVWISIK